MRCYRTVFLLFVSVVVCLSSHIFLCLEAAVAETFYVSVEGDDDNPGTRALPWRSVAQSTLRLTAGDRLLIGPGDYRDEGQILVRAVEPETFQYLPLEGSEIQTTQIRAATKVRPRIFGNIDIRGSHITVAGLTVIGDQTTALPGIGVYESHNINIANCCLAFHGGGGVQFNHSDMVRAVGNYCFFNATTNPDQHSGISSFQPIVRTNTAARYGVIIGGNVCVENRNEVPDANGDVTDGNGIIIDDHIYSQFNALLAEVVAGVSDQQLSSGDPRINVDKEGRIEPYGRRSAVYRNTCFGNGGRGIHVLLSSNVLVLLNHCESNLESEALVDSLPTDDDGNPFFVFGEISVVDSTLVRVSRNFAVANKINSAAGAELLFDLAGQASSSVWFKNTLINEDGPIVSVANSDSSDLLEVTSVPDRHQRSGSWKPLILELDH